MNAGVLAAFSAALLYNLAIVLQKTQAEQTSASGVRILGALWKRPLWLLGIAIQMAGFGLHSFALTSAPVTVVQPIIASGIAFVVIFAALILGERPTGRELLGMAMSVAGLSLLVLFAGPLDAMQQVSWWDLGLALGGVALLTAALLQLSSGGAIASASVRAVLIGLAAGLGDGMSDTMNRLLGAWLAPGEGWVPPAPIGIAAAALLFAFGFQGFVTAQNGLKLYRANTVIPCILITQLLVPIAMASLLYGQRLPQGSLDLAIWLVAIALSIGGIATLSRSAHVAALRAGTAASEG
jgi:drug/metabolite transporter (DMT)-like permease